ncbi:hypothetical protein [Actinoplanes philippinensis]|uniref:hypothetical protein n=1 Tax=Actinoplanes philippinensis TaxID=35752 RepID=UPI0033E0047A
MPAPARLWRIHRIYLDRIGAPAARFRDVWLEFASRTGNPLDTILWMRNGGGKSTLIALICASIRPARNDYLATAETGRHLEDCVLGSDTAHIAIEWQDPDGRRMVTGAVYEWTDRLQPADPNASWKMLQQCWYAFTPSAPDAELGGLPFEDGNQHPTPLKNFAAAILALPPHADPVVVDDGNQGRWANALHDRGLDPGLFTAILKINATEGGIEKQFKFSSTDDFVRYLLALLGDSAAATTVSKMLVKHRESIARHPRLRTELAFTAEAVAHLALLAGDHERVTKAAATRDDKRRRGQRLAAGFAATAAHTQTRIAQLRNDAKLHRDRQKQAADNARAHEGLLREYQWWAADLANTAAANDATDAEEDAQRASRTRRAWQLVPTMVQLAEATARLGVLRGQQQQEQADAEPVRRAYQHAAAQLIAVIERSRRELAPIIAAHAEAARIAGIKQGEARAEADAATKDLGALTASESSLKASLAIFTAAVDRAVRDGHLPVDADLYTASVEARDEHLAVRREIDEDLPAELAAVAEQREPVDTEHATLTTTLRELGTAMQTLKSEREPLLKQIEILSRHARLTLLAQADTVDPIAANTTLRQALSDAILAADSERIDLAVDDAADRRALQSLAQESGLLPPSLDLARAAEVLSRERIPATTGWHYLADSVAPQRWAHAINVAPHLVSGLLVHDADRLEAAQDLLEAADLRPGTTVQVSTTAALQSAIDNGVPAVDGFIVTPASALFNRSAVPDEVERRSAASAERAHRIETLDTARDSDQRLIHELTALIRTCPPGHLEHLAAEHGRIITSTNDTRRRLEELDTLRKEFDIRTTELNKRKEQLAAQERLLNRRAQILQGLADQLPAAEETRARLAALPNERTELQAAHTAAREREKRYRITAEEAAGAAGRDRALADGLRREISELAEAAADLTAEPDALTLAEARSRFATAREAQQQQASRSALAATIASLEKETGTLSSTIGDAADDVRDLAAELAATAVAADSSAVRQHIDDAERQESNAQRTAAVKQQAAQQTATTLGHCTTNRPAHVELMLPVTEPTDKDHATALVVTANEQVKLLREQQQTAGTTLAAVEADIDRLAEYGEQFDNLSSGLLDGDQTLDDVGPIEPYRGTITEAMADADAARKEITAAERAYNSARSTLSERGHAISRWAGEARFAHVAAEVKDRFLTAEHVTGLAIEATHLTAEIDLYRSNLQGQLDEVEQDKQIVVSALCEEARSALKMLQRAQSQSQLPHGIGEHLKNRRFLDVGPRSSVDTGPAVMRSRITTLVDSLVQSEAKALPDGKALTWQAVSAAVGGPGNFVARVLKPSTNLADEREPVERMGKWSGGEKVTISLLLFCMLARLRAASRGTDRPGLGVLPMDNPLGTVNYVAFLDLQRQVAAANGIQLIFLSGLADMRAIGRFPNIIRMKNTHNHGRTYAKVNERDVTDDQLAASITTARLTFPMQESLL